MLKSRQVSKLSIHLHCVLFCSTFSVLTVTPLFCAITGQEDYNHDVEGQTSDDAHQHAAATTTPATFPLERHINVAVKMLSLDPNLAKMHARLIASMPEKTFWFHYFSRIAALRNEVGIEPLCEDLPKVQTRVMPPTEFVHWSSMHKNSNRTLQGESGVEALRI